MDTELEEIKDDVYPEALQRAIDQIPAEYREMSEDAILTKLKPTLMLYQLRQSWWEELARAHANNTKMRVWRIYQGHCSRHHFYDRVIKHHLRLAWIISPLVVYEDKVKALLQRGLERYEEIIAMDITTTKVRGRGDNKQEYKEVDPKKAAVLLSAIKNLEDRVKGGTVQRQVIEKATAKPQAPQDLSEIDEKLKELEGKMKGVKMIDQKTVEVIDD